mmetsp:Transcript_13065/g.9104  ORF Transcript_13065/g.9104 Transcript_13065/m.9104 type:complete len:99 (-) Transcript_13065:480-776(-)
MCEFVIVPSSTMVNPKLYYKLENFYGNHRSYVKSRSYAQLRGDTGDFESNCDPIVKNSDLEPWIDLDYSYDENDVAYPCGFIGKYAFSDRFMYIIERS